MINQNRGTSEIEGDKKLIFCEFSTLVFSLLDREIFTEKEIDEAVSNAKEGTEFIGKKLDKEIDELAEKMAEIIVNDLFGIKKEDSKDENN